jgi:tyrosyl-tRNA synthetase
MFYTAKSPIKLIDLVVLTGLAKSKTEAKKLILSGGIYLNNIRITEPNKIVTKDDCAIKRIKE